MHLKEIIHDNSHVISRPQAVRVLSGYDFFMEKNSVVPGLLSKNNSYM